MNLTRPRSSSILALGKERVRIKEQKADCRWHFPS